MLIASSAGFGGFGILDSLSAVLYGGRTLGVNPVALPRVLRRPAVPLGILAADCTGNFGME